MLILKQLALWTFSLAAVFAQAKIIETCQIRDILPYIDKNTWVLVDLDNTLFESTTALGHADWFGDELKQRLKKGMSRDEAIAEVYPIWVEVQKVCHVKPLDKDFVPVLQSLQGEGITMMGLTHRQPAVAESTIRQVRSLDFDFTKTAPARAAFVVPAKTPTEYTEGILFVGDYNKKVDVFEPFLEMIRKSPKKVVFIDDKRKNVEELEQLAKRGIEYVGIHYRAIDCVEPVYNPEIAAIQYKYLHQILSNEAARCIRNRHNILK